MEGIRIDPSSPLPVLDVRGIWDASDNLQRSDNHEQEGSVYRYSGQRRKIAWDGVPFLDFQHKIDELRHNFPSLPMQIATELDLTNLLLPVLDQLRSDRSLPRHSGILNIQSGRDLWPVICEQLSGFPIPLRQPKAGDTIGKYFWLLEFAIIGTSNGLLRPYEDETLRFLAQCYDQINILDELLSTIRRYDFYGILERILDLKTDSTELFGGQALLSSIQLEDDGLLDLLLKKRVPLSEVRHGISDFTVSAIHLAAQRQHDGVIRRLLEADIDPDGNVQCEDVYEDLRPLSYLLKLRHSPQISLVGHTSNAAVSTILSSQRNKYPPDHCDTYLATIFLRAWTADVPDFGAAIRRYCRRSLSNDGINASPVTTILGGPDDDNMIAEKLVIDVLPKLGERDLSDDLWASLRKDIVHQACRRRCLPIVKFCLRTTMIPENVWLSF